jgi:hypothetical protein
MAKNMEGDNARVNQYRQCSQEISSDPVVKEDSQDESDSSLLQTSKNLLRDSEAMANKVVHKDTTPALSLLRILIKLKRTSSLQ